MHRTDTAHRFTAALLLSCAAPAVSTPLPASAQSVDSLSPDVLAYVTVREPVFALTHVRMVDGTGAPAVDDHTIV
ncbi:MAG: hypothetical protein ACRELX_12270, partial [Longimicrobiales bacterium]